MNDIQLREDALFERISALIDLARKRVKTAIDTTMVYTYYGVGHYIVEDEQQGEQRAQYGKAVLKNLSARLTDKYGEGWSVDTLENCRKFYQVYSILSDGQTKSETLFRTSDSHSPVISETPSRKSQENVQSLTLSWSHYLVLMRIKNDNERRFYEIECQKQDWSVRQLKREYGASLYERLALSRDKEEVIRLSKEGQTVEKPKDIIKDPLTLEFLGLKRDSSFSESSLESAIISKLQDFLLEMGKGFLFEARQKKILIDDVYEKIDLVFYHRILKCHVLIELKPKKFNYADAAQLSVYMAYYRKHICEKDDNPPIGILLCTEVGQEMAEYVHTFVEPELFLSKYELQLPPKEKIIEFLKQENTRGRVR